MQTTKSHIEYISIEALIPYARNSRTHDDAQVAQIAASIREFGFTNPVLIDSDGGVIAGHGRIMAARKLSLQEVPCIRLGHLTDAQKRAYVIADNKLALNAGWDESMLNLELGELQDMGFDISLIGFGKNELSELMAEEPTEGLTDENAVPEVKEKPKSQRGDVWLLGEHRLMCGDSTQADDLAKLMDGDKADLVWTDPPYNVAIDGKAGKIMNDDMSDAEFRKFLDAVYARYFENMRDGAVIYVAHADSERVAFTDCFVKAGLKLSQILVWAKQSGTLSRQDFN